MNGDVVVVGGGAVGACCALELARRGARVTLLERGADLAWGCSAGNAGLICPSHYIPLANPAALRDGFRWMLKPDSPFYLRPRPGVLPWIARFALAARPVRSQAAGRVVQELARASLELHAALADEGLDTGLRRDGVLNVYFARASFEHAQREAEHNRRAGLESRILAADETYELEPSLGPGAVGAVLYPGDAHCDPLRFVKAVGRAAERGLPSLRGRRVLEVWRGLRPCTPDGLPIVGRPAGLANVTLATGHAMMGLTLAPITGRLVAELLAGERPSLDLRPLSPNRFRPLLGRL